MEVGSMDSSQGKILPHPTCQTQKINTQQVVGVQRCTCKCSGTFSQNLQYDTATGRVAQGSLKPSTYYVVSLFLSSSWTKQKFIKLSVHQTPPHPPLPPLGQPAMLSITSSSASSRSASNAKHHFLLCLL
eukprot:1161404-Pelagomonas_calceolata.AAC.5